ncbi:50S ribosomal protein L11 methyltransferase [Parvicella tangerina]|uniref:Ribosomal protein L11 methyltransferase n=1 Tax=Parvicella tangerina TaxID=2829795 RepID=A0A916JNQ3_9FLAO|nr:50S ribosomal protein L11 methyltransferase [Parvicella tangerina]CAG5084455.1 Release factor glutamine methyltransferase [Parvicella tangerina]
MNYVRVEFILNPLQPAREILYADLDILGFEAIEDTQSGAIGYMPEIKFTETILENLMVRDLPDQKVEFKIDTIEQKNWNEEWESQFQPIQINSECVIRAPFHKKTEVAYDIVILPKMSFGTGHHETTFLMAQELFQHELKGKSLMDMGCGTGVLAILAKKLGAEDVEGVDIEEWAYENSIENAELNQTNDIKFFHGDVSLISNKQYDVILANINRNILLNDMKDYAKALKDNGSVLLSGFYETDVQAIVSAAKRNGLNFVHSKEKNGWAMIQLSK